MDGGRSIQAMTGVFQVGDAVLTPFRGLGPYPSGDTI